MEGGGSQHLRNEARPPQPKEEEAETQRAPQNQLGGWQGL